MNKRAILGLVSAMLMLTVLPAYFAYVNNMSQASETQDTDAMTENVTQFIFDGVRGEIVGGIVLAVCSIVLSILASLGLIKIRG